MATSGSYTEEKKFGLFKNKKAYATFSWERTSYSIQNNTSTISWRFQVKTDGVEGYTYGAFSITIDNQTYIQHAPITVPNNATITLLQGTTTISHNNNGTKDFSVIFKNLVTNVVEQTLNFTLDTLPVKPKAVSVRDFTDESVPTLMYTPYTKGIPVEACISFTGEHDDIPYRVIDKAINVGAPVSYRFNFTDEEKATLWAKLGEGTSVTVRFIVRSKIEDTYYEDYKVATLTFVNYEPILAPTVRDINPYTVGLTGNSDTFIKYFSNAEFKTGATARKGAQIDAQYVKSGDTIVHEPTGTIENITSNTFYFSATDSNGYTTNKALVKTLIPYVKLTCSSLETEPLTANGTLRFTIGGKYFNGSFGAKSNTMELEYALRENDGDIIWTKLGHITPSVDEDGNYTYTHTITGLNHKSKYELIVNVIDELSPVQNMIVVVGAVPVFDWSKNDFKHYTNVYLANNTNLRTNLTDGTDIQLLGVNNSDDLVLGWGGYDKKKGETYIYGDEIRLTTNDKLYINNNILADYVIEQGSNGIWFYRKWNSGRIELVGYRNISSEACNVALGGWFRTQVLYSPAFPMTVHNPKTTANYESNGYGAMLWFTTLATNTKPGDFYLIRPTSSGAISGVVNYYVTGTWK